MLEKIQKYKEEITALNIQSKAELEDFRLKFLSKKGLIPSLFEDFKSVPNEQKKSLGAEINILKQFAEQIFADLQAKFEDANEGENDALLDLSLPAIPNHTGTRHPLAIIKNRIIEIFARVGFSVAEGPEIEDDWHNFSALNFPENHPAREMQDTFFVMRNPDLALRTHTSSVQVRTMEKQKPPIRILSPGRVFRNEAITARAHCFFHQIEGLYINEKVSVKDLKDTLLYFAKELFGKETKIRMRPSYFPFTEPSVEIDVSCMICGGKGCNVCKHSGWVEIMGAGMVDPNVLENCGIDSATYSGFAFGMGIERITMLKYQIKDLRLFSENDVRFLRQFHHVV
ncbi:MAG: phenylalanine--tRNA ligase subunit alpha [Bacteroidetes bacterium]|nr:MAG: phenylalanine--tRNA ligase subunit alpha [Bacteroidota bacterium]